jgi:hypothetical protein
MKSKIIAVQEELLQKSEWEFFLRSSVIKVVVLSKRQMTFELSNEMHNKFQYSNFYAVHAIPSGYYPTKYDLYLFAPQNFTEAQNFSIKNPKLRVVVLSTPEVQLNIEEAGNFSVRTWQYIPTYIAEIKGVPLKELKEKLKKDGLSTQNKNTTIPDQKIRRWSDPKPEPEPEPDDESRFYSEGAGDSDR